MSKTLLFFGLVSILSLSLVASNSYASGMMGTSGFKMLGHSNLIGAAVENSCGKVVGIVNGVAIDSGGHRFAIVNHGDYDLYGDGGANTLVPLEELRISRANAGQQIAFLKTDTEHLDFAPSFDPTMKETRQDEASIYEYYGIQPYWTQSGELSK